MVLKTSRYVLPGNREEHDANTNVAEDYTDPNFLGQWIQEAKNSGLLLHRFLDHDGDAERHERLAEVDDAFSFRSYCHWRNGHIRFLEKRE